MGTTSGSLDLELVKNIALGVSIAALIGALILLKIVRSVIGKVISVVVLLAIAIAFFSQRASIEECAQNVRDQAANGQISTIQCTFFGQDIKVDLPDIK